MFDNHMNPRRPKCSQQTEVLIMEKNKRSKVNMSLLLVSDNKAQ